MSSPTAAAAAGAQLAADQISAANKQDSIVIGRAEDSGAAKSSQAGRSGKGSNLPDIQWRSTTPVGSGTKGDMLYTALFNGIFLTKLHLKVSAAETKNVMEYFKRDKVLLEDRWTYFIEKYVKTIDVFQEYAMPTAKTLRETYLRKKDDIAKKMRWGPKHGGSKSNLSDEAGDLTPLETVVRNIMQDEEEEREAEEARREEVKRKAEELDQTESGVIVDALKGSSKRQKPDRTKGTSSSTTPASAFSNPGDQYLFASLFGGGGGNQSREEMIKANTEETLSEYLEGITHEGLVLESKLDNACLEALKGIPLAVIASVFVEDNASTSSEPKAEHFKREIMAFADQKVTKLQAHILYTYLKKKVASLEKQKEELEKASLQTVVKAGAAINGRRNSFAGAAGGASAGAGGYGAAAAGSIVDAAAGNAGAAGGGAGRDGANAEVTPGV